jgi:RNA polymerase sigma-70 factor (ECF subfamily)
MTVVTDFVQSRNTGETANRTLLHDEFQTLFGAAYGPVVRTVWLVTHDWAVAEEVTQEAFVELYRRWSRVRTYDRPDLWVRRVAIRKAQREAARAGRRTLLERSSAEVAVEAATEETDPALVAAIRMLSPRQRAVVVLFYLEDRPMAEVADLVGCSASTGFVHLHRARHRLAEILGEEVGDHVG